jgi:glycerophosphodiester phosphodiesterase
VHGNTVETILGKILLFSARSGKDDVAKDLLESKLGVDLDYASRFGETALYCAAQAGNLGLVQFLIKHMLQRGFPLDVARRVTKWTPLMVACANGHSKVVQCLWTAGAKPEICDSSGWTALEHASFRGHLEIAGYLMKSTPLGNKSAPDDSASSRHSHSRVGRIESACGAESRLVVVNLGSTRGGHEQAAVEFTGYGLKMGPVPSRHGLFELEISTPAANVKAKRVGLPMVEDRINRPFVFKTNENVPLEIVVRLYRRESICSPVVVSSGTAILDRNKPTTSGEKHESMIREIKMFMMDCTLRLVGTVLLSYVVATPFTGLEKQNGASSVHYGRLQGDPVRLVGHRGT